MPLAGTKLWERVNSFECKLLLRTCFPVECKTTTASARARTRAANAYTKHGIENPFPDIQCLCKQGTKNVLNKYFQQRMFCRLFIIWHTWRLTVTGFKNGTDFHFTISTNRFVKYSHMFMYSLQLWTLQFTNVTFTLYILCCKCESSHEYVCQHFIFHLYDVELHFTWPAPMFVTESLKLTSTIEW